MESTWQHTTVLLKEAVQALLTRTDGTYIDATFGRGGHSRLLLSMLGAKGKLIAFDKDLDAIAEANTVEDPRFSIRHEGFSNIGELPAHSVTAILLDLGVSSPQIDNPARGFSFRNDGPLDMRMDTTRGESVAQWLATADMEQIAEVIRDYGEERIEFRLQRRLLLAALNARSRAPRNWPSSWLARSRPASGGRTPQPARFRPFGFSSTPSLKSSSRR